MNWNFYQAIDLNLADNQRDLLLLAQQIGRIPEIELLRSLQIKRHGETQNPKEYTWYNEPRQSLFGTLALWVDNAILVFQVDATLAQQAKQRYVVQIEWEQLIVDSVNTTTNEITFVARWDAWTAAVAHLAWARLDIVWKAEKDWTITSDFVLSERTKVLNYFQEFTDTVEVTQRAVESSNKDRANLLVEERTSVMRKQLQLLNKSLRMSYGKYDAVNWEHTINGYKAMIENYGWVTQSTLWYINGAFDYNDRVALLKEMETRWSNVMYIHTNTQTKQKLVSLMPDKEYRNNLTANEWQVAWVYFDWIVATSWDGRIFRFIIDNSIVWNYFSLLDLDNMWITPWISEAGVDKMYLITPEVEDSSRTKETLRTQFTLKVDYPDMMAVCDNI